MDRPDDVDDPTDETHAVTLVRADGSVEVLAVDPGETVVDAANAAGVSIPYGCLYGACGTCTARLLGGEFEYCEPPRALKPEARNRGFVLACIATPTADCRLRVGHAIQAEAVGTPWK
ncbi:2Fe-2S iron-sulfur cluster-binding protein [Natrialbaceae archaeon AArc-T1-2]|uniref:2Fe-2S iron-sulfur cluster-binding protein n=1 Tax=Natrialbaceae archaeon AArc-T1-2 TaxID=3053904 RepID=UPI00255B20C8|nr:2Fe-2S iron-sulfur cluster-binding protein [Natrialbaceae archaeon AArc-T1-2]WIV66950.1 2Fe-2S iron-sulfur cluster-binding protein [Natrialbaceae archaeon AArc-T1-2]